MAHPGSAPTPAPLPMGRGSGPSGSFIRQFAHYIPHSRMNCRTPRRSLRSAQTSARATRPSAAATISSRQAHSSGEWGLCCAGREVGRGQPLFGQSRAVGAAADDRQLGPCGPAAPGPAGHRPPPAARGQAPRPCCDTAGVTATSIVAPGNSATVARGRRRSSSAWSASRAESKSRSRTRSLTSATPPAIS